MSYRSSKKAKSYFCSAIKRFSAHNFDASICIYSSISIGAELLVIKKNPSKTQEKSIEIPSSGVFPQIQQDLSVLLSGVCLNFQGLELLEYVEPRVQQSSVTVSDNYRDKGKHLTAFVFKSDTPHLNTSHDYLPEPTRFHSISEPLHKHFY